MVDSKYPMRKGFLAPFNYLHSSFRSVIERTFGVWKSKWKILKNMSAFCIRTQGRIIVATMVLRNFIRAHEINNDVERSRSTGSTSGHSERGHYNGTCNLNVGRT